MDRKAIFGWAMYDFANSAFTTLVVTFIYATYFTKAIANDEITGTVLWSRAVTISAVAVALLSPILGALADQGRHRKQLLFFCTAAAVASTAMLYTPLPGQTLRALLWFGIANTAFELGYVFYNAFLPDIAPPDKIGRISGLGWGLGYLGGLAAMFVAMVCLVNPATPWFGFSRELGQNIRATNLLVAVWFGLFSLPLFFFVKARATAGQIRLPDAFRQLKTTFHEIRHFKQIVRFLAAHLLYNDGLITIFAFGGIYAAGTFQFTFREIMLFGIVLNITAGIGALAAGFIDDRLGGKATIQLSLAGLAAASLLAVFAQNKPHFWVAGIIIGICSGPNQAASRSLMARFVPNERESQFFGFFSFSGKITAFLGPFFLGLLTDLFDSQRLGVSAVILFFVLGAVLLAGVDEQEGMAVARAGTQVNSL